MKKLQPKLEYFVGRMANDGHGLLGLQWLCRCRCRWWSWNPFLVELARFNEHWSNRINLMHSAGPWPISSQWLYFHLMWITRTSIIWCAYVDDVWFFCRNFVFYFNQQRTPRNLFSHFFTITQLIPQFSLDTVQSTRFSPRNTDRMHFTFSVSFVIFFCLYRVSLTFVRFYEFLNVDDDKCRFSLNQIRHILSLNDTKSVDVCTDQSRSTCKLWKINSNWNK